MMGNHNLRKGIIWVRLRQSRVFGPESVFTQTLLLDSRTRDSLVVKNGSIQKGSSCPFLFLVKHCFYHQQLHSLDFLFGEVSDQRTRQTMQATFVLCVLHGKNFLMFPVHLTYLFTLDLKQCNFCTARLSALRPLSSMAEIG